MKRLRGWRKEVAYLETPAAEAASAPGTSRLASKLLSLWAHGLLSAAMVQELAYFATLDGAAHTELVTLAKAGNFGGQPGNAHRDIMRAFVGSTALHSAWEEKVPALDPKTGKEEPVPAAIFLPHLTLLARV